MADYSFTCSALQTVTVTLVLTFSSGQSVQSVSITSTDNLSPTAACVAPHARVPSVADVYLWVSENPGADTESVGDQFGISYGEADEMLEELLNKGLLDFA